MTKIPYKWIVAVAFVAGLFMDLLDATIVNVALPTLARDFHTDDNTLEWVVNAYLLSLAIWIPASGWIGDKFGTKKTFLFALLMFTLGSILCGFSWSVGSLIFFRVLQGIGGGMMTPVGTAMLFRAFPPHERAKASSILTIPVALSPTLGPVVGGWLTQFSNWRWIFYINVPIGILAFIFGALFLQEHTEENAGKFDVLGFILSGAGLVLVLFALSTGPSYGWTDLKVILSASIGIILLSLLVFLELGNKEAILHFSLFKERIFRTTNIIMFFAFSFWLGFLFILPLFLQQELGFSAFESGLTTFPQALGWLVMSLIAGGLYPVLRPKKMIVTGLSAVIVVSILFSFIDTNTNIWIIRALLFVRGLSMAFAVIPIQTAAFANISSRETGRASSFFNTNRQVASSFGVALLGTILFQFLKSQHTFSGRLFAYHITFFIAAILGVITVLLGLSIRDEDAAATFSEKKGTEF